jgi:2,5-furandicarboxylate decarboxylase 1
MQRVSCVKRIVSSIVLTATFIFSKKRELKRGKTMPKNLSEFLIRIKDAIPSGYLEVDKEIDAKFELCALLQHLENEKRFPTVLFKNVKNLRGNVRNVVVSNLFATRENLALAVDLPKEEWRGKLTREVYRRIQNPIVPRVIGENEAPVKSNKIIGDDVDIGSLPIIRHHEMDAAPYFTMAVVARHPEWGIAPGIHNVSFHRMQYKSSRETGIHMSPLHTWHIFRSYEERNLPCPIALVIGHHPMFYVGANMNPAAGVSEYDLVGGLLGEPLRLTPSTTLGRDFLIPADAEFVIEGEILPNIREAEAPFGEWTRCYGPQRNNPKVKIKAINHKNNPIFLNVFIGHRDSDYLGLGWECTVFKRVEEAVPTLDEVYLPPSGCGGYHAYIKIKKTVHGQPINAGLAALTWGFLKLVVVVDDDIDIFNEEQVWWAVATRVQAGKQVQILKGIRGSILDPSIGETVEHDAIIIDATKPLGVAFEEKINVPKEYMDKIKLRDFIA